MKAEEVSVLRERLGWEVRRCAAYLGVDYKTWRLWETGARAPSRHNAEALLAMKRLTETACGRATLVDWAEDAKRRRAIRKDKRNKQSQQ
jgi:transcriptional regulator with XRE-family HTH domain